MAPGTPPSGPGKALYVGAERGKIEIVTKAARPWPPYKPESGSSQTLVNVKYSAINPADLRHSVAFGWQSYITGYEWVGTIVETGSSASPYSVGDVLFGLSPPVQNRPDHGGAHQDYLLLTDSCYHTTWRVPPPPPSPTPANRGPYEGNEGKEAWLKQVVAWPVGLMAAVDAFFNIFGFAFPPLANEAVDGETGRVEGDDPKGKAILIWGGASAVGVAAIQVARMAGFYPILTTASPHNHATLRSLGATACFDYRSPTVVDEIRAFISESSPTKELATILDTVSVDMDFGYAPLPDGRPRDTRLSSPDIAKRCLVVAADKRTHIRLSATLPVLHDPSWIFCNATRSPETHVEWGTRAVEVTGWVIRNHAEVGYRIPKIRTVKGAEEGLQAVHDVFDGKVSMEKVVIEHPM